MNFPKSERSAEIFKPFVDVTVRNAIMHRTWEDGQYTSYAIYLETNHCAFMLQNSCVRRRYSEFAHLRNLLTRQHPNIKAPVLPPKALFEKKIGLNFIEKRRCGLELFLQKVFSVTLYLSNRTVHLFTQSCFPMHRIELIVEGRSDDTVQCEPHLILNQHSLNDSMYSESPDFDQTDFDMSSHHLDSSTSSNCSICIMHNKSHSHSHVSQGAKITICTPSLHVPKSNSNHIAQSLSISDSIDSDYSILATSSPKLEEQLIKSNINSKTLNIPPISRNKKVSFSSDIVHSNYDV